MTASKLSEFKVLGFCFFGREWGQSELNPLGLLTTISLYAPRMAAVMMPRNKPITLSTTEVHIRRYSWTTSQQLLTPVNS